MSKNIVVTAGDVRKEGEDLFTAAAVFWLIGLISDTWYVEYPMFFLSFFAVCMGFHLSNVASSAVIEHTKETK